VSIRIKENRKSNKKSRKSKQKLFSQLIIFLALIVQFYFSKKITAGLCNFFVWICGPPFPLLRGKPEIQTKIRKKPKSRKSKQKTVFVWIVDLKLSGEWTNLTYSEKIRIL
jgi:hypothetical protein